MTALPGVRRKRTAMMLTANLLALASFAGLGIVGVKALKRYHGATKVSVQSIKMPVTPVGLLATVSDDNELTSVTTFVLKAGTQLGGSIVSLPVSTDTTGGVGDARIPLTEVYSTGGTDALVQAVESTLLVSFDVTVVADATQTEALLQQVSPLTAQLPDDVRGTSSGRTVTLFKAGETTLTAEEAAQVLTASAPDVHQAARRGGIDALWAAVVALVGPGRTQAAADAPFGTMPEFLTRLFAGPVEFRGLQVATLPADENPDGKDVESLDRADTIMVFGSVAPGKVSSPAAGLTFRIEAPPGNESKVRAAIKAILYLGGNVQSIDLNGSSYDNSRFLIDDPQLDAQATSANALFGNVQILRPDQPIEGIDVILQLGNEYLNAPDDSLPATTTTTETG